MLILNEFRTRCGKIKIYRELESQKVCANENHTIFYPLKILLYERKYYVTIINTVILKTLSCYYFQSPNLLHFFHLFDVHVLNVQFSTPNVQLNFMRIHMPHFDFSIYLFNYHTIFYPLHIKLYERKYYICYLKIHCTCNLSKIMNSLL